MAYWYIIIPKPPIESGQGNNLIHWYVHQQHHNRNTWCKVEFTILQVRTKRELQSTINDVNVESLSISNAHE